MPTPKNNCFAYDEKRLKEYFPGTMEEREWTYRNCMVLKRLYCAFEQCSFYKTQRFLEEENLRCQRRLKELGIDKKMREKYGNQQQTERGSL